jgi:hypothetical protein
MRGRLLRGIAAAAISLVVLLPVTAQPAQAQDVPAPTEVGKLTFTLLLGLGERARDGLTPAEVAVVLGQVVIGVRDSGTRILAEIDGDRVADSMTALRNAMGYVSLMGEGTRDANKFFSLAMHAAHVPHSRLESGSPSQATIDALGRVAMTGYDLYLTGRLNSDKVAGRPTSPQNLVYIVDEYLQMLDTLTSKLKPDHCMTTLLSPPGSPFTHHRYSCQAFDGTVETWQYRFTTAGRFEVQRGTGAGWEEGEWTRDDELAVAKLAMRNTILFDAFQAQIKLLALRATLTAP